MRLYEFIFSEERNYKLTRHLVFWICWWIYFFFVFYLYKQPVDSNLGISPFYLDPGDPLPVKTLLLVLLFAFACYPLIYMVAPKLIERKWFWTSVYLILLCSFIMVTTHFLYWHVFPLTDSVGSSSKTPQKMKMNFYWPAVSLGLLNFVKVAASAVIIKYIKSWWLKQKESQRLEKEKINAELQLLKAQIQPEFLFKTLDNLYTHALTSSPQTSIILLKLSDLLSYMLYECDQSLVPLEIEIAKMKEYIQLEKLSYNGKPEMEVNVKGELTGRAIAPFLLLPFIEQSFKQFNANAEQPWINMDIHMEGDYFTMKLAGGVPQENNSETSSSNGLTNVQKRLALLYPQRHELKISHEQEMQIIFMRIKLDDKLISEAELNEQPLAINRLATQSKVYADHS